MQIPICIINANNKFKLIKQLLITKGKYSFKNVGQIHIEKWEFLLVIIQMLK